MEFYYNHSDITQKVILNTAETEIKQREEMLEIWKQTVIRSQT